MKIDTPDSGFLTADMVFEPDSTHRGELASPTRSWRSNSPSCSPPTSPAPTSAIDDVLDATEYVTPSVELIAARSFRTDPETGRTRTVIDTIADNAADAGIVCGGRRVGPREVDLRWVGAMGTRNGVIEETGLAGGVLGHPATGIVWLARRYAEQGLTLEAGQTILAGSFTRPIDIRPGDEFDFDYGDLGQFGLQFS